MVACTTRIKYFLEKKLKLYLGRKTELDSKLHQGDFEKFEKSYRRAKWDICHHFSDMRGKEISKNVFDFVHQELSSSMYTQKRDVFRAQEETLENHELYLARARDEQQEALERQREREAAASKNSSHKAYVNKPRTDCHNLKKILKEIDAEYFQGLFNKNNCLPDIYWWWRGAKRNSKSVTGGLALLQKNTILIHRLYDSTKISSEALSFLVYHELLHLALYRARINSGHTNYFRYLEDKFTNAKARKEFNEYWPSVKGHPIGNRRPPRKTFDTGKVKKIPIDSKLVFDFREVIEEGLEKK